MITLQTTDGTIWEVVHSEHTNAKDRIRTVLNNGPTARPAEILIEVRNPSSQNLFVPSYLDLSAVVPFNHVVSIGDTE